MKKLRYGDAQLALVHPAESKEPVQSALVWPECHTLLSFPDGVLLHLVLEDPTASAERRIPMDIIIQRLRFEIFRRFDPVDNFALQHDFSNARVIKDGKNTVLASDLWLRQVGAGGQSLTVSVHHHLAYFALVRALRSPNPAGFKCLNGISYGIKLDPRQAIAKAFDARKRGSTMTDATLIEETFRSFVLPGVTADHVFLPQMTDTEKKPMGRWYVTLPPQDTPNPLDTATYSLWPADPQGGCYTKQDGRFALQLSTTTTGSKKRTVAEMLSVQEGTKGDEEEMWVMVDGKGTVIPQSRVGEYQMIENEQRVKQRLESQRLLREYAEKVRLKELERAKKFGPKKMVSLLDEEKQEPARKKARGNGKLDSFILVNTKKE